MEKNFEEELEELLEKRENKEETVQKLDENEEKYLKKQLEKQERISKQELQELEHQYEIMASSTTSAELARLNGVKKEAISELEKKHKEEKEKIEKKLDGKEIDTSDVDKEIQERLNKEKEKIEKNNKKLQMYLEQYKDHEKTKERIEEQIKKNDEILEKIKRIMGLKFKDLETSKIREIFGIKKKEKDKNDKHQKDEKKDDKKSDKYDSRLTQEQKDELIANGIEPGDPEYNAALENYGIKLEKNPKEQETKKEVDLSSKLTQEQKDELAAEGLESGDPEYGMALENYGVKAPKTSKEPTPTTDSSKNGEGKEEKKEEKIKVELSAAGLTVDGVLQDVEANNKWYKDLSEKKKLELQFIKDDLENFSNMQLNIFKALLKKDTEKNKEDFTIIDRLNSAFGYSDDFKGEHNIDIGIDLTKTSIFDRMLGRCKLSAQEVKEMKDMAYEMRDRVTVKAGPLTKLGFKIREMFEKSKQKSLLPVEKEEKKQEDVKKNDFKESIKVKEDLEKEESAPEEDFELKLEYNDNEKTGSSTETAQTSQVQENESEKQDEESR